MIQDLTDYESKESSILWFKISTYQTSAAMIYMRQLGIRIAMHQTTTPHLRISASLHQCISSSSSVYAARSNGICSTSLWNSWNSSAGIGYVYCGSG